MKFCSHCGTEIRDAAVICPQCGCAVTATEMPKPEPVASAAKYCTYCGAEVRQEAVVCPKCGCPVKATRPTSAAGRGTGLQTAAKVFMVLGCVCFALLAALMAIFSIVMNSIMADLSTVSGVEPNFGVGLLILAIIYLVPLIWTIPMTQHYFKATREKEPVGIGFKICTLLFVNLIAGILMLCDNSDNK